MFLKTAPAVSIDSALNPSGMLSLILAKPLSFDLIVCILTM